MIMQSRCLLLEIDESEEAYITVACYLFYFFAQFAVKSVSQSDRQSVSQSVRQSGSQAVSQSVSPVSFTLSLLTLTALFTST